MSMKIKRIELKNFRFHKHKVFIPQDNGIIAVTGPSGSGKSSILNGLEWALYGTKPKHVAKHALLKNNEAQKTDDSYVKVDLEVEDHVYRVKRSIKGASTDAYIWRLKSDGYSPELFDEMEEDTTMEPFAAGAVSVKKQVEKILNMDEKGFLTAIKVAQKEVDNIVFAGKAERGKVIEDLTGISALTFALSQAKEEHKELKKISDMSVIDKDEMIRLESTIAKSQASMESKQEPLKKLRDVLVSKKQERDELRAEVAQEQKIIDDNVASAQKIVELETRISTGDDTVSELLAERQEKKKALEVFGHSPQTVDEVESELEGLRRENNRHSSLKSSLMSNIDDINKKKHDIDEQMSERSYDGIDMLKDDIDKKRVLLNEHKAATSTLQDEVAAIISEGKKLKNAVEALSQDDGTCPTCLQRVEEPDAAIALLEKEMSSLRTQGKSKKAEIEKKKNDQSQLESELSELDGLLSSLSSIESDLSSIEKMQKEIDNHERQEKILAVKIKDAESRLHDAKMLKTRKDEYDKLIKKYNSAESLLKNLKEQLSEAKAVMEDAKPLSAAKMSQLRTKSEKVADDYDQMKDKFMVKKGEYDSLKQELEYQNRDLALMKSNHEKYEKTLLALEKAVSSMKVVEEYREDKISESLPLIEAHASELMSRFTSGAFLQVNIDQNFKISVMRDNGTKMDVELLSGGELSAAAMAVRLAIAIVLSNGGDSTLILDEALVSQDSDRASNILSVLKDYFHGQLILIAHSDIIHNVADQIVEM